MTKHQSCAKCIRQFVGPDSGIGDNLCPDCDYEVHCKCEERIAELEKQLADEQETRIGFWECLDMVRRELEQQGTDMSAVPPMFYNDAVRNAILRKVKDCRNKASDELKILTVNHPKTADGFSICLGMTLWTKDGRKWTATSLDLDATFVTVGPGCKVFALWDVFSTRQAAEKARE